MDLAFDTGYRRSPVDHRDWSFSERVLGSVAPVSLPRLPGKWEVDARSPILESDQGDVPSCLAHAFAYLKTIHERKDKRRTLSFDAEEFYSHIALPGGGAYFRDALRVARSLGLLSQGKRMRIGAFYAVNPRDHFAVKHALKSNRGLVIGFEVTRGWMQNGGREFQGNTYGDPNEVMGGHGMFLSGWNPLGPVGPNSWGQRWNGDGRGVLPWHYWDRHVWECWAIEDVND